MINGASSGSQIAIPPKPVDFLTVVSFDPDNFGYVRANAIVAIRSGALTAHSTQATLENADTCTGIAIRPVRKARRKTSVDLGSYVRRLDSSFIVFRFQFKDFDGVLISLDVRLTR